MRVLVVEDDALLGDALSAGLRQSGHAVDWFINGAQADAALAGISYDVAVLDLGLPGGDGVQWLATWRGRGVTVPVLILTARDGEQHRIAGLDGGADDYLVKPISTAELAARLRAMMRRRSGFVQPTWEHGALRYDPAGKVVWWRGATVALTSREMALLEVLMADPQRVLSKAHLQEKLYDWHSTEPESNTLEVYVHHLRKKIDSAVVRTVRGVGYALGSKESLS